MNPSTTGPGPTKTTTSSSPSSSRSESGLENFVPDMNTELYSSSASSSRHASSSSPRKDSTTACGECGGSETRKSDPADTAPASLVGDSSRSSKSSSGKGMNFAAAAAGRDLSNGAGFDASLADPIDFRALVPVVVGDLACCSSNLR